MGAYQSLTTCKLQLLSSLYKVELETFNFAIYYFTNTLKMMYHSISGCPKDFLINPKLLYFRNICGVPKIVSCNRARKQISKPYGYGVCYNISGSDITLPVHSNIYPRESEREREVVFEKGWLCRGEEERDSPTMCPIVCEPKSTTRRWTRFPALVNICSVLNKFLPQMFISQLT